MGDASILIGSPVNTEPAILKEFLISLSNLNKDNLNMDFLFIDNNTDELSKKILREFKSEKCGIKIIDTNNKEQYVHTEVTHKWTDNLIWKVAGYRNNILKYCKEKEYDYLFMIDSDLLIHPETILFLTGLKEDIISEIFWTRWVPGAKEFPQVWLYDNYTLYEVEHTMGLSSSEINKRTTNFIDMLRVPGIYKVGGLGGCTLISKKAIDSGVSYERIPNVSFWGEDRHFCIRAAVLGFTLYVDTHYPAYHIYRKSDLPGASEFKKRFYGLG
ncbi:MAG: hypothetical protein QME45_14190 [Clostridiales bacterium]|nr:hypothetical protein [Clostridiales bacterium]HBM81880.1 hypothetical protein [Clostridiaceae bacterium]